MAHRVRTHYWESGHLATMDYFFDTFEQAVAFTQRRPARSSAKFQHHIKIYNDDDQLVQEIGEPLVVTYA